MRISDWSSDVCSSDLEVGAFVENIDAFAAFEQADYRIGDGGQRRLPRGLDRPLRKHDLHQLLGRPSGKPIEGQWVETQAVQPLARSEWRRAGKKGASTCIARGWPYNNKKTNKT